MSVKLEDPGLFWEAQVLPSVGASAHTHTRRGVDTNNSKETTDGLTYNMTMVVLAIKKEWQIDNICFFLCPISPFCLLLITGALKKKLSSKKQATSAYIKVITSQKTRQSLPMIIIITTTTFYKYTYRNRATQFILVEVCAVNKKKTGSM